MRDCRRRKAPDQPVTRFLTGDSDVQAQAAADKAAALPASLHHGHERRRRNDNNLTENVIRPFVTGRKNFLFCDSVAGANASANLDSLIETAKANGIEPYAYLKRLFTQLPQASTVEVIEARLPIKSVDVQREAA